MLSYHRFKRHSGALAEPIPVHPDANYRPEHRPIPQSAAHPMAAPKMVAAPVAAAPLAAGTGGAAGGFSPWWILGPLLALLAALALGILAYAIKKKNKNKQEENQIKEDKTKSNPTKDQNEKNQAMPLKTTAPQRALRSAPPHQDEQKIPLKSSNQDSKPTKTNSKDHPVKTFSSKTNPKMKSDYEQQDPKLFSPLHDKSQKDDLHNESGERSPTQHGIGKSPLLPTFPSGTKRKEKKATKSKSNSSVGPNHPTSNPSNQLPQSSSATKIKPKDPDENVTHSIPSERALNTTNPENEPNERNDNLSKGSFSSPEKTNENLLKSLMPHVPQCKGSGSSSEDENDYDELYSMTTNSSSNPFTSKKRKTS